MSTKVIVQTRDSHYADARGRFMLTVTTRDGSAYDIDYRETGGNGQRLAVRRHQRDGSATSRSTGDDAWYQVNVLKPDPPRVGESLTLVLDLLTPDNSPAVHRTGMVMSVVGTL